METKRVLVIGVTSALGEEVARQRRAMEGCSIYGTYRSGGQEGDVLNGVLTDRYFLDVRDVDARGVLFDGLQFDEVHYMVGVASAGLGALAPADQARVLDLNFHHAVAVIDQVARQHLKPGGVIIVASSAAAWWGMEYAPAYSESKRLLNERLVAMSSDIGFHLVLWTPGAINTKLWNAPGIPVEVRTAVRWFAPHAITAVRKLLAEVDRRSVQRCHSATPVLTTADAYLSYHYPVVAWLINHVLSALVEYDARRSGRGPLTWRAVVAVPLVAFLQALAMVY